MEWDLLVALAVIVIFSISLIYILFSLDRDHEREMDRISSEMKELDEKQRRMLVRDNASGLLADVRKEGNGIKASVEKLYYGNQ